MGYFIERPTMYYIGIPKHNQSIMPLNIVLAEYHKLNVLMLLIRRANAPIAPEIVVLLPENTDTRELPS